MSFLRAAKKEHEALDDPYADDEFAYKNSGGEEFSNRVNKVSPATAAAPAPQPPIVEAVSPVVERSPLAELTSDGNFHVGDMEPLEEAEEKGISDAINESRQRKLRDAEEEVERIAAGKSRVLPDHHAHNRTDEIEGGLDSASSSLDGISDNDFMKKPKQAARSVDERTKTAGSLIGKDMDEVRSFKSRLSLLSGAINDTKETLLTIKEHDSEAMSKRASALHEIDGHILELEKLIDHTRQVYPGSSAIDKMKSALESLDSAQLKLKTRQEQAEIKAAQPEPQTQSHTLGA